MELPRHVHRYGGVSLIVSTQAALDEALADGWHLLPPQSPPEPVAVIEPPAVDAPVETPKRRGRPRKG